MMDLPLAFTIVPILILGLIGFVFGWLVEFLFKSLARNKLVWPELPNILLYVFATTVGGLLCIYYTPSLPLTILIGLAVTTGPEFIVGWYYLRFRNRRLWDYSDTPFNYRGIISLPYSLIWLLLFLMFRYMI